MSKALLNLALGVGLLPGMAMAGERPTSVSATFSASGIVITNPHDRGICYAVHESDLLKRIEWAPACSPGNRIAPNGVARVPATASHFEPSGEIQVSWWFDGHHTVDGSILLKAR